MAYKAEILLGKIVKPYGFDGTVTVKLERDFTIDISELKSVFLEIEGKQVPFIIAGSDRPLGEILRLRFDGYNTLEKVAEFTGCRVFLTSGAKGREPDKVQGDLKDFKVVLADDSLLGTVTELIQSPGNLLLNVKSTEGKDILIPLHEDLILGIDKKKKIIRMDLPEGLTAINL